MRVEIKLTMKTQAKLWVYVMHLSLRIPRIGNTFELLVRVLCNENVTKTDVKLTCSYLGIKFALVPIHVASANKH